jgi:hypothetical protein
MPIFVVFPHTHIHARQKLDLHNNRLGGVGAYEIAKGITEGGGMPCLDELYLSFNDIGTDELGGVCV